MKKLLCALLILLLLIPGSAPAEEGPFDFAALTGLDKARELLDSGETIDRICYTDGYGFSISEFVTTDGADIEALWKALNAVTVTGKTNEGITDWYPQIFFFFSDESQLNIRFDAHWLEIGMDHYTLANDEAFWNLTAAMTAAYAAGGDGGELSRDDYYASEAVTVDSTVITPQELETAMKRHLLQSALSLSAYGQAYDTVDRENIIDTLDKVLFDLEIRAVVRAQAEKMGLDDLPAEEYRHLREAAREAWENLRDRLYGDNALAFLPAGDYRMIEGNPDSSITRYLASFGLTEDAVYSVLYDQLLEQKLMEAVTGDMENAGEYEKIDAYTDWILERFQEADIHENGVGIAEVCFRLIP